MATMQTLSVPTASITDVKKSPDTVFALAADTNNAVYVFNRGAVSGVMMTQEQFESMIRQIEELEDRLLDAEAARRLALGTTKTYSDASVIGKAISMEAALDENDCSNRRS